ncbi:MAG TPA: S41 family peptidase [Herpetosiphonaceae bacterium]
MMNSAKQQMRSMAIQLRSLRQMPVGLSRDERLLIVEQALALLELSYIHLPQKRAMYAVDPIQRLRLLKYRIEQTRRGQLPDELLFHAEMLEIFTQVRDLHTNYLLPAPYNDQIAYLPFLMEQYFDDQLQPHFIVTWIDPGADFGPHFVKEVEVLYWNGVPIKRAVELNAARQAGSNTDAYFERGLAALTIRPLVRTLPPDEDWVSLRYLGLDGKVYDDEFAWQVSSLPNNTSADLQARATGEALAFGFDIQESRSQPARVELFFPEVASIEAMSEQERLKRSSSPDSYPTSLPTMFRARVHQTAAGQFGYIRVFTFMHPEADVFVAEFQRLIQQLPQNGLIIDVRGNGGGNILACERLLQLFTSTEIEPARFQFINSPLTLALSRRYLDLQQWSPSIAQAVETGAIQSLSFPITSKESCNAIGRVYHGPVVLITDARCYSATDLFAAGFQDHRIGKILGTSGNTGAGGANVWTHSDLCALVGRLSPRSPMRKAFKPLPRGAEMRVAMRRCLRVRENAGIPIEDLGVVPHARHYMTKQDLLENNVVLLDKAARLLVDGG